MKITLEAMFIKRCPSLDPPAELLSREIAKKLQETNVDNYNRGEVLLTFYTVEQYPIK